ncbi:uncharacterized protein EHS24_005025 [Apiotrichum porosum]|uniref:Uncharacterized protein n=1 Tax=Apiotrichum porosum TaxID=105984 RepID=A0A427Y6M8_9TREE|nr:uncharacterized protein EHS24_005025 [Apiotrichum porosum]RSH86753.1 hypothetical protein EHS24_005025 [Apiotrichum porosum]
MPAAASPSAKWTPEHDTALLRAVVATVLANRRNIYATTGLEDVAGNGGSRINQKIQQMLKKLAAAQGRPDIVDDEVAANSTARGGGAGGAPKKVKKEKNAGGPSKKRKVKVEDSDDDIKVKVSDDDE